MWERQKFFWKLLWCSYKTQILNSSGTCNEVEEKNHPSVGEGEKKFFELSSLNLFCRKLLLITVLIECVA